MILAIDQGTTGTTCLVFDEQARLRSRAYREFTQHFPRPGWVEHDANEIWEVSRAVAHEALGSAGIPPGQVSAVGITNQRETVVAWDERTGAPLHRAIVWQDRRTAERCDELREQGFEALVRERTGLVVDPVLLRDEDRVAAAKCSRTARARRRGRRAVRDDRRLAGPQAHRPRGHGLDERVAHDAVRHPHPALGRRAVRRAGRRAGGAARAGRLGRR